VQIEEAVMSTTSSRNSLLRLLEPVVADLGLDLEDVIVTPAGKRRVVRVVVDQDGGVDLDQVATVSTAVSAALDAGDTLGGSPYVLEVSSPGVDRPLTEPRHWRRNRSRLVEIVLADASTLTGRVLDADEQELRVEAADGERVLTWAEVDRGRVQIEFKRASGG
jgi:ribosome maturation factor RimP